MSGKLVSQEQSGLGGQKGCAPLWPCVSVDSATVQVRTEVTLWGCAGDGGEPRIAGNVTVVSSCGVRGPGIVRGHSKGLLIIRRCARLSLSQICAMAAHSMRSPDAPTARSAGEEGLEIAVQDWTGRQPRETEGGPASALAACLPARGRPTPTARGLLKA